MPLLTSLATPPEAETALFPPPGRHLLLVEDYEANILFSTLLLEDFGWTSDVARTGFEAVALALANRYSAILMDVEMPGMDGLEATRQIRAFEAARNLPRTPIIAMTAHAFPADRLRCLAAGMDDYVSKPFEPAQLGDKLAALPLCVPLTQKAAG